MQVQDLPRFYHASAQLGNTVDLMEDEVRHLKVLRLNNGDPVHLIDGEGHLFEGKVMDRKKGLIHVEQLLESQAVERRLTLLLAPTKNINRTEWVVEKATEIGVTKIIPIQCEHSERDQVKVERLLRIAISAAKQSKDLFLPVITEMTPFEKAIAQESGQGWIAHCMDGDKTSLRQASDSTGNQVIAIGPEGDFTASEVVLAKQQGYRGLDLGAKRLRTETAAIAAILAFQMANP